MFVYLMLGIGYGFAAAAQPGPFQAFIVAEALNHGWRRALPAALAPLLTDGPIIVLVLLVLTRVPVPVLNGLYIAGGLFILYLAYRAYEGFRDLKVVSRDEGLAKRSILKAALLNALSPGPYLYWGLVTGPILVGGFREAAVRGVAFLGGFYAAMVGSLAGIILAFGAARRLGPRVNRAMLGLSAAALGGFGLYQLWRGISGFVG